MLNYLKVIDRLQIASQIPISLFKITKQLQSLLRNSPKQIRRVFLKEVHSLHVLLKKLY